MPEANFLQIHTLTPYAAALLNRDDIGRAKRLPFGGADRTRISSQCLKRHWRRAVGEWSLNEIGTLSVRSRHIFDWVIAPKLRERGLADDAIVAVLTALKDEILGKSEKPETPKQAAKKTAKTDAVAAESFKALQTEQVIVLGQPEIAFIADSAAAIAKKAGNARDQTKEVKDYLKANRANLAALTAASGLDAALFGRMVTSDILARGDAAIHVAHAFTVHGEDAEPDYFTAVDDLTAEQGELGSGHINTSELTSGLFYGYVVVDLRQLVGNLSGDQALARAVGQRLVHLIARVSPGAKLSSTAPYGYAELVLIEAGIRQPRSLANAFLKPVGKGDLQAEAVRRLSDYLGRFDRMYPGAEQRRAASLHDLSGCNAEPAESLDALAEWAAAQTPEPVQ